MTLVAPRRRAASVLRGFASVHGQRLETARIEPGEVRPKAPPIVFLHDAFGSLSGWERFPRDVAQLTRCPVLVYSRSGHGRSDAPAAPPGIDYLRVEAQAVLPALLDSQGLERPLLVGHEDGASIALVHAGSGFEVAGVVGLAPRLRIDEPAVSAAQLAKARLDAGDTMQSFARQHREPGALIERWATLWQTPAFRSWTLEPFCERISAPVVLIQGEDDEHASLADLALLTRALRGRVQTMQFEAIGHAAWQEAPNAVAAAIGALVDRVAGH